MRIDLSINRYSLSILVLVSVSDKAKASGIISTFSGLTPRTARDFEESDVRKHIMDICKLINCRSSFQGLLGG